MPHVWPVRAATLRTSMIVMDAGCKRAGNGRTLGVSLKKRDKVIETMASEFIRLHYDKVICACCFLAIFCNIGLASTSFSVYQPYIVEYPGVGHAGGSVVISARLFSSLACMFFVARFYRKLDCRFGVFVSCCLTGLGYLLFAFAEGLIGLCVGAVFAGAGYGLGGMVVATMLIGRWFKTHIGFVAAVAALGSGVASMVVPPLVVQVTEAFSLQIAFGAEGVLALALGLALMALIRNQPSDMGLEPYDRPERSKAAKRHHDAFDKEAADRFLPLVYVAMACVGACCVVGAGYFGILLTADGFSPLAASGYIALSGFSLAAGKLVNGMAFDHLGTKNGSLIFFVFMTVGFGLSCLCGGDHHVVAFAAAVMLGAGMSLGTVGTSVWSLELAPEGRRVVTIKNFQVAYMVGACAFNFVPGLMAEASGTYAGSYAIMGVMSLVSAVIIVGVYWYAERRKKDVRNA